MVAPLGGDCGGDKARGKQKKRNGWMNGLDWEAWKWWWTKFKNIKHLVNKLITYICKIVL